MSARWSLVLVFASVFVSSAAFARGGTGAGNSEYKNAKSTKGLCNDDSKDEDYYKQGYCLSLAEQFKNNPCTKEALAELRTRYLAKGDDPKFKALEKQGKGSISLFACNGKGGGGGKDQDMDAIAKDQEKFDYVMMQWVAMLVVQTSNWDVLKDEDGGPKGPGGLLGLSLESGGVKDMENKDYACGCKDQVATTSGQSNVTVQGQSPGPLDGHHSLTCGSYMILKQLLADGTTGMGKDKNAKGTGTDNKDTRKGAAKIVAALEDKTDDSGQDKEQIWRSDKMDTFCQKYWSSSESKTNHWDDEIGTRSSQ